MNFYQELHLFSDCPVIRLLELHLCIQVDNVPEIEGSLTTHDLRDLPNFDALSYAWGPKDLSAHITLHGEVFLVSQTLFAALRQICVNQQGAPRKLWVDAICINQHDNAEKSHQVMLMKDIYASANRVLSWIGQPDQLSTLAFDTLKRFAADDGTPNGSATYRGILKEVNERRASLDLVLQRGYFSRLWIVQEVVVARMVTVLCGSLRIDFDKLRIALQRMTGSGFYRFSSSIAKVVYIGSWRSSFHETDYPDGERYLDVRLFEDSRDRIAADARDKIYALRGIANKALGTCIKVDYDDAVETVYTDFAKTVLSLRQDLQILSAIYLRHGRMSTLSLPSYVPDWSLPKYGGGFLQRYYRFKPTHVFRAAGTSIPRVSLTEGSNTVGIQGSRLDVISRVIPIKSLLHTGDGDSVVVDETILRELSATASPSLTYGFTNEPSWVAFFRTLTADRTALSPRIDETYWSQYFGAYSEASRRNSSGDISSLPSSLWEALSKDVGIIIEDKDMFVTAQGYFGLGHEGLGEGDVVCILLGGEVPFLLRQTGQGGQQARFRFLCECYVHGVMDGEAVKGPESGSLEEFLID